MSRFMFVVPPFAGHVLPTVSVGRTLMARGHQVTWVGLAETRKYLPADVELSALHAGDEHEHWSLDVDKLASRGWESLQVLWEDCLVPLARGMLPAVNELIAQLRPDVVIADQQAIAGALAARRAQLPWATFCTTSASVMDALAELPKVKQWILSQLASLEDEAGLPHLELPDTSSQLVVVFSTEALVGRDLSWPAHYRFVGPSIEARADETPFPWHELGKRPRVFVSLGTIGSDSAGNARFFAATVDALRDFDGQVILVAPNGMVTQPPASFIVRERVPQLALLREVDAVVTHGGHNTVCEALAHGLPMVVAPIRHDQPTVAAQVVRAGAAVRVRYGRISANVLRDAVERALHDPELRAAAMRVGESFRNAGGAQAAAQALEQLA